MFLVAGRLQERDGNGNVEHHFLSKEAYRPALMVEKGMTFRPYNSKDTMVGLSFF
jgi:hypothetical protein